MKRIILTLTFVLFVIPLGISQTLGTSIDQNSNSFTWKKIGNQYWSTINTNVESYRDGTPIPQVTDASEWVNLTTGAWCYYNNDTTKGKLYNWYAVAGIHDNDENTPNKEFAPEGWNVPTDTEWTTLENYLIANGYNYEGTTTENKIAKSMASITGWNNSTSDGAPGNNQTLNNSSGFNAQAHGFLEITGTFKDYGIGFNSWHSSEDSLDGSKYFRIASYNNFTGSPITFKQEGLSVRFVSSNPSSILLNGTVSAESNQIKNVADPTDAQDAATKNYVDSNVNAFSGSYNDLTNQPSLRDLAGDNSVIFGSLSAFGGTYNNRAILDLVANTEGNLITGYKNGSSGDRFNVKLDNTNENAVVSSGGGYNLKLYSEGGTMEFEGDAMMSTPSFTFNGAVTATSFAGDGSQLTNLPTSDVSYNDLTDKPTTYTQSEVDALILDLQNQINGLKPLEDVDGNTYDFITYGDQTWSVENAEMEKYRDGTEIPQVTDDAEWQNLTTGAWCYIGNDSSKGKLYNWYAVMGIHDAASLTDASLRKEFAPEGWHVPTDAEWTILEEYLIANAYNYDGTTTGNKIAKAMASTTGWTSSTDLGAIGNDQSLNNSSGFNAFPEGPRYSDGSFGSEGGSAFFWSSTEKSPSNAWNRYLSVNGSNRFRTNFTKQSGFSVRFVRD